MSIAIRNSVRRLHVAAASRFVELNDLDIEINEVSMKFNDMIEELLNNNISASEIKAIDATVSEINKASPVGKVALIEVAIENLSN